MRVKDILKWIIDLYNDDNFGICNSFLTYLQEQLKFRFDQLVNKFYRLFKNILYFTYRKPIKVT